MFGNSDNNWTGSVDDMTSTSDYEFSLGSRVFLCSKEQQTLAQSSTEAEYAAASLVAQQAIWLKRIT